MLDYTLWNHSMVRTLEIFFDHEQSSCAVGNSTMVWPSWKIDVQSQGHGCLLSVDCVSVCHILILCQMSELITSKLYSNFVLENMTNPLIYKGQPKIGI